MQLPLHGLYAITDNCLIPDAQFIETIEQAITGGVQVIQYRDKTEDKIRQLEQAQALRKLCYQYHIPLLINDNIVLAQQVEADGIHIGQEDVAVSTARTLLGENAIIGVSCYNQLSLAQEAMEAGANYVAFGSFFPSQIKPLAVRADTHLLQEANQQLNCPIVAIGGITADNGGDLIQAGANFLAVIQGIFGQSDVKGAAQRFRPLFNPS